MTWLTGAQLRERARQIHLLDSYQAHGSHQLQLRDTSCASVFILECAECTRSTRFICFVERHRGTYDLYGSGRDREDEKVEAQAITASADAPARTNSVLTVEDVLEIRSHSYRKGLFTELGRRYRVNRNTIKFILERKTWRHI